MDVTGPDATRAALTPWESYYVITGSAAAALTGLQFVVQTLIAQGNVPAPTGAAADRTVAAFSTPTVVHFAAALLLSAGLRAPWPSLTTLRLVLLAAGLGGVAYVGVVFRRVRRSTAYQPVAEDWAWHIALPAGAYGGLVVAAGPVHDPGATLSAVAGLTLLLLCVGIHNAWDSVTYLSARRRPAPDRPQPSGPPEEPRPEAGASPVPDIKPGRQSRQAPHAAGPRP